MTEMVTSDFVAPVLVRPLRARVRPLLHGTAGWSLFAVVVIGAFLAGLILRRWAWDQTEPVRYQADINNAFLQGSHAIQIGYLDRYDDQMANPTRDGFMDLDYAPGRLAIATLWTHWVREKVDGPITDPKTISRWSQTFYARARTLKRQYELCRPMLMVNLTGEIFSAIAMFFLVRRYTSGKSPDDHILRGNILGLLAALFFWFDPALIWNAHCWPQWDSWVLPFFLWALVLACWNWWFCAGVIIATGAMFKGQILFGAPIFLLWPLFQLRFTAAVRWIVGLLFATACITAVWTLKVPGTNPTGHQFTPGHFDGRAVQWVIFLTLMFGGIVALYWPVKNRGIRLSGMQAAPLIVLVLAMHGVSPRAAHISWMLLAAGVIAANLYYGKWTWHARVPLVAIGLSMLVIYPLIELKLDELTLVLAIEAMVVIGLIMAYSPKRFIPFAGAGSLAVAVLLCMPLFGTSRGWFDLGFAYGTHHFERMASGQLENLPELLQYRWGWDDLKAPVFDIPAGAIADHVAGLLETIDHNLQFTRGKKVGVPLKYCLVCVWLGAVVLCGSGAAVHDRNRSPRFLAAIAAPWIVFFAVMTQMHQRYLLWGASLSAASAVISPGYAILHFFLSIVSMSQEMESQLYNHFDGRDHGQYANNWVYRFIESWHPGVTWAVLLTAAIYVYTAVKRDRRTDLIVEGKSATDQDR